jgi:DNA-binding transcriptional LysR family regulator
MPKKIVTHSMLEAFRAAMVHGGITAGASALDMSQPSMSRLLTDLQKLVGLPLFVRHGRTVLPTEEARALLTKVNQSFVGLDEITRFSEQLGKQRLGRVTISAVPSIGHSLMPQVVESLSRKHPDVIVSLNIGPYWEVARRVRSREADLGFTGDRLSIGDLETVAEFSADSVCIGSSKWLPKKASVMSPRDLVGKPFIGVTGSYGRQLEALMAGAGQQLDIKVEASLFQTASELVLRGMGISVVDAFTGMRHRMQGGITRSMQPTIRYSFYATAMADTRLSKPVRDLLQYVTDATEKAKNHSKSE